MFDDVVIELDDVASPARSFGGGIGAIAKEGIDDHSDGDFDFNGDEIADVGGNDPDNRRMMRFDGLNQQERRTRDWTSTWAKLRSSHLAMLYGTTEFTLLSPEVLLVTRTYLDQQVHVALNRSGAPQSLDLTSLAPEDGQEAPALVYLAGQESATALEPYGAVAFEIDTP